jgi:hypothetical protein
MDDRKKSGEERIAEHTSRHNNQKIAWNTWYDINSEIQSDAKNSFENTTQQIMNKFVCAEKNQRFLFNFGALSPNLFLDFSQHIRYLR